MKLGSVNSSLQAIASLMFLLLMGFSLDMYFRYRQPPKWLC